MIGLELYVINFSAVLPGWWVALIGTLAGLAGGALLTATFTLRRSGTLMAGTCGPAGDVFDDIPLIRWNWLLRSPWHLGVAASLLVGLAMTLFEWRAENSLIEGLQRGVLEGLAAAAGFALLGRAIGVTAPPWRVARAASGATATWQLAADQDRAHAEAVLRESFAHGRLSLEELTARVAAIHDARTIGELQAALRDLPHSLRDLPHGG